jgi:pSer/pThr/pTyr-binding forkhead associated (FHA) protein
VATGTRFCAVCGAGLNEPGALTASALEAPAPRRLMLAVLDESGQVLQRFERTSLDTTIGRDEGDIRFPDDSYLSPLHAKLSWEGQRLVVRDLGSRNGTWVFLQGPHRLDDDDLVLAGSQVLRFRRLGYPGPRPREVDETQRMGSVIPSADIAMLLQLRSDGSTRDVIHLSPGRDVHLGRERGDWIFPYDTAMSAQHAIIRSEDADFVLIDAGSRNGVARAVRGDLELHDGERLLVGDKILRVELPA